MHIYGGLVMLFGSMYIFVVVVVVVVVILINVGVQRVRLEKLVASTPLSC